LHAIPIICVVLSLTKTTQGGKVRRVKRAGFCGRRGKLVLQKHASHFKIQLLEMGKKEPCSLKRCMALYYNNNRRLVCEEHPIKSLEIKWGLIKTT